MRSVARSFARSVTHTLTHTRARAYTHCMRSEKNPRGGRGWWLCCVCSLSLSSRSHWLARRHSQEPPLRANFVCVMLRGGRNVFSLKGGDAQRVSGGHRGEGGYPVGHTATHPSGQYVTSSNHCKRVAQRRDSAACLGRSCTQRAAAVVRGARLTAQAAQGGAGGGGGLRLFWEGVRAGEARGPAVQSCRVEGITTRCGYARTHSQQSVVLPRASDGSCYIDWSGDVGCAQGSRRALTGQGVADCICSLRQKKGGIILGIGGDNSDKGDALPNYRATHRTVASSPDTTLTRSRRRWRTQEWVPAFLKGRSRESGYASDATEAAVHANVVSAGYGR